MSIANWNDDYSVKIKEFDDQHKKLFGYINDIHEAMKAKKTKEELGHIITKLLNYTVIHFGNEERYFQKFNYPQAAIQKVEHQVFIDKIKEYQADFKSGKNLLSIKMINFLKDWLINHINGTDKKYISFFKEKGL